MKTNIENKVLIGFLGTFTILFVTAWFLYKNNITVTEAAERVSHTNEVLQNVAEIRVLIADFETRARGAVLSENKNFTAKNEANIEKISLVLKNLKELTKDNSLQQRNFASLEISIAQKIDFMRLVLQTLNIQGFDKAKVLVASQKGENLMTAINRDLARVQSEEQWLYSLRQAVYKENITRTHLLFIFLFALAVIILTTVYVMLRKNLTMRFKSEANNKNLNLELENYVLQLETANKALQSFSYSVSHDLRAPLRAVHGYAVMLSEDHEDKLDDEAKRLVNVVINNAEKMGQLIDGLLVFSRLEKKEVIKHPVAMDQLVNEITKEFKTPEDHQHVEFIVDRLPGACGDAGMLKQVWENLISNAIKYSKIRKEAVIKISSYKEKNDIVYSITDNGVGFDMLLYNKLFGMFQRLHNTNEFEGTGVGLAIVQKIISKHEGKVWAEGKVDTGAKFCFSIPNG